MALNQIAKLYGFGSYFERREGHSNDIDLLVIHVNYSTESIELALQCKRGLVAVLPTSHITILSHEEERELEFLHKCRAVPLGAITIDNVDSGIDELEELIQAFPFPARLAARRLTDGP